MSDTEAGTTADARLTEPDSDALDALIDAGFDPELVSQPLRDRAQRVAALFGLLDTPVESSDAALGDLAYLRVLRAGSAQQPAFREAVLCEQDQAVVDALVEAGLAPTDALTGPNERRRRHTSLAAIIAKTPLSADAPADLTARTLAHIQSVIDDQSLRMDLSRRRGPHIRLSDLVSVAAALLLAASVLWPAMSVVRNQSRQAACRSNLQASAFGLSSYAGMNDDALPMITAGLSGLPWWNVGTPRQSNSANIFHLARGSYVNLAGLACPGNPQAPTAIADPNDTDWRELGEVSYSYRIMFGSVRPNWGSSSRIVILADRSPVVLRAVKGQPINPWENSPNHGGRGQTVLFSDGSTQWLKTTTLESGDNIYLPRPIEQAIDAVRRQHRLPPILGTETPASLDDAFVGP